MCLKTAVIYWFVGSQSSLCFKFQIIFSFSRNLLTALRNWKFPIRFLLYLIYFAFFTVEGMLGLYGVSCCTSSSKYMQFYPIRGYIGAFSFHFDDRYE
jgi:hypothetical protein